MGVIYSDMFHQDVTPKWRDPPTFDPLLGFQDGRKERKMIATETEMEAAGLSTDERDYCAHHLIDYYKCRDQHYPWVVACKHQRHLWDDCQFGDFVLRMKEYERERRLLERAKRKDGKGSSEMLED